MTSTAAAVHRLSSFSRTPLLSRSVFLPSVGDALCGDAPPAETLPDDLPESEFKNLLVGLDKLRGKTAAGLAKRRTVLDSLGALVFARMGMHRSLFRPQWEAEDPDEAHYDSKFRPLDLARDVLFDCTVVDEEVVAVVERKGQRITPFILTRTVRFPLRYVVDDGESLMWADAAALLQMRRVARDEANTQFDNSEAEVQSFLAIYSPVSRDCGGLLTSTGRAGAHAPALSG